MNTPAVELLNAVRAILLRELEKPLTQKEIAELLVLFENSFRMSYYCHIKPSSPPADLGALRVSVVKSSSSATRTPLDLFENLFSVLIGIPKNVKLEG